MRSVFALLALLSSHAGAYPEFIRHGYSKCLTCHLSPNGGGVLTDYGRSLSGAALSWKTTEGAEKFLFGAVPLPKFLKIGGDVRLIQTVLDYSELQRWQAFVMQADLEPAVVVGNVAAVAAVGYQESRPGENKNALVSRRHFVLARATRNIYVRAGKFDKAIGIKTPDHILVTKRLLGWDQGTESYNLEGAYLARQWDLYATATLGQLNLEASAREKGFALRPGYVWAPRLTTGLSYFYGSSDPQSRHVVGPYLLWGITKQVSFLFEADAQLQKLVSTNTSRLGAFGYAKLDWEAFRGFHVFLSQEWAKADLSDPVTERTAYGLGLQFFPFPHFEIQGVIQKSSVVVGTPESGTFGWGLIHYYF